MSFLRVEVRRPDRRGKNGQCGGSKKEKKIMTDFKGCNFPQSCT